MITNTLFSFLLSLIPLIALPFLYNGDDIYNKVVYYTPKETLSFGLAVLLFVFSGYCIYKNRERINKRILKPFDYFLLLFGVILLLGLLYTDDSFYGMRTAAGFFIFMSVYIYFRITSINKVVVIKFAILTGVIESIIVILQYFKIWKTQSGHYRIAIEGTIGNVVHVADYLALVFVFSAFYIIFVGRYKKIILAGTVFIGFALIMTQTRAAFLGSGVALILGILLLRKEIIKNKKYYIILTLSVILEIAATALMNSQFTGGTVIRVGEGGLYESTTERRSTYKKTLMMIAEKPIFGHGTGSFFYKELEYENKILQYIKINGIGGEKAEKLLIQYKPLGHTHNEYLQFYMENGIFIFILFILMGGYIFFLMLKTKRKQDILFIIPVTVIMVTSLFNFPLHMVNNLVLLGIMIGLWQRKDSKKYIKQQNTRRHETCK